MSGRLRPADIEQQFELMLRQAAVTGWELIDPEPEHEPREQWRVIDAQGRTVMLLGYTTRDAMTVLQACNGVLSSMPE